jgi:hypothetical protein
MKTNKDNPETLLATLGKQDTWWRQTRTIRRHYWQHWEYKTHDEDKQGQSGDTTGNIGKTRHRMKTNKNNPETQLATLGKQETGWRPTRTIRRHYWQHWENRTQDEDKQGLCLRIVLVCLHPVSCFPNVASSVFGLSLSVFILFLVFPMLPVVQGQSEDTTDNIGKTRHRMKTYMDNLETLLATLGKQDTGWRQTRTIRRHNWQHWENKTYKTIKHNTTQKTKKDEPHETHQNRWWTQVLMKDWLSGIYNKTIIT